jgi:hypothetical protein
VCVCILLWQTLIALWMEEGLGQGLRVGVYVDFGSLGRMITDFSFHFVLGLFFSRHSI